jgi:hypothetical protein
MKTWEKPRLIVLARGKPEEAVMTACKGQVWISSYITVDFCTQTPSAANVPCGDCYSWVTS